MNIFVSELILRGAPVGQANPLPRLRAIAHDQKITDAGLLPSELQGLGYSTGKRVLPCTVQDRYTRNKRPMSLKTVELENDRMHAIFLPEYGGRLYSLFDKDNQRELLSVNPVFQPANLAIRNAWFSGGIEWNVGQYGHSSFTCSKVHFALVKGTDGKDFLRLYAFERIKELYFSIDFKLLEDRPALAAHVTIYNRNSDPRPVYYWTNIAVPFDRNVRVFSETDEVIYTLPGCSPAAVAHGKLPILDLLPDVDCTYPEVFPFSAEYFFQNPNRADAFWEMAAYNDGTAFVERSTAPLRYRKMFTWPTSQSGIRWQEYLSTADAVPYLEVQAGLDSTQIHGSDIPANSQLSFTQLFAGADLDHCRSHVADYQTATKYCRQLTDTVLPLELVESLDREMSAQEDQAILQVLALGEAWGYLEELRTPGITPKGLKFYESSVGTDELPWLNFLKNGALQADADGSFPAFMTSARWFDTKNSPENTSWELALTYGLTAHEQGDSALALRYFESAAQSGQPLALYTWAALLRLLDRKEESLPLLKQALASATDSLRLPLLIFYFESLVQDQLFNEGMALYQGLPDTLKAHETLYVLAAECAEALGDYAFCEPLFDYELALVRENEPTLSRLWYRIHARKLSQFLDMPYEKVLSGLKETLDPPYIIDFRSSKH